MRKARSDPRIGRALLVTGARAGVAKAPPLGRNELPAIVSRLQRQREHAPLGPDGLAVRMPRAHAGQPAADEPEMTGAILKNAEDPIARQTIGVTALGKVACERLGVRVEPIRAAALGRDRRVGFEDLKGVSCCDPG